MGNENNHLVALPAPPDSLFHVDDGELEKHLVGDEGVIDQAGGGSRVVAGRASAAKPIKSSRTRELRGTGRTLRVDYGSLKKRLDLGTRQGNPSDLTGRYVACSSPAAHTDTDGRNDR